MNKIFFQVHFIIITMTVEGYVDAGGESLETKKKPGKVDEENNHGESNNQ